MNALTLNMNLDEFAVTQFQGFIFNSIVKFGDVYLAAGTNGVYEIETGQTDDNTPIESRFDLPETDFGSTMQKKIRRIYANGRFWGPLQIKISGDGSDEQAFNLVPEKTDGSVCSAVADISQTIKARNIKISVLSSGYDFTINSMSALVVGLTSRPPGV